MGSPGDGGAIHRVGVLAAVLAFTAVDAAWIFGLLDPLPDSVGIALLVSAHVALGAVVNRFYGTALVGIAILLGVGAELALGPAGEMPRWFLPALYAPAGAVAIAIGTGLRRVGHRRRRSNG